jgi:hypothetical protein
MMMMMGAEDALDEQGKKVGRNGRMMAGWLAGTL